MAGILVAAPPGRYTRSMNHIDLRSDTVTWPTPAMREAMAAAPVGDDVYGDDPTVNELEARAAARVGKEAGLFVPSGTFGNQLALFTWSPRGSEVILGEQCHIIQHEAGGAAVIAGVQIRPVDAPTGVLDPAAVRSRIRGGGHPPSRHLPRLPGERAFFRSRRESGSHGRGTRRRQGSGPSHPFSTVHGSSTLLRPSASGRPRWPSAPTR